MNDIDMLPKDYIENLHRHIGMKVKQKRLEKGVTQLELSHAIGHKSVSIVSRAEIYYKGQHFNLEHLARIAFVFDIELEDLICSNQVKISDNNT